MSLLKTPADLGNVIRQRRKALGWDQARLAQETGVSRQWIIDIEKGKPRAELQLVLRALNVLGIELDATARQASAPTTTSSPALPLPDIDRIVESSRTPLYRTPTATSLLPGQMRLGTPLDAAMAAIEQQRRLMQPLGAAAAALEQARKLTQPLGGDVSPLEQMRKLVRPFGSATDIIDEQSRLARLMEGAASYQTRPEGAPTQSSAPTATSRKTTVTRKNKPRARKPAEAGPAKSGKDEGK